VSSEYLDRVRAGGDAFLQGDLDGALEELDDAAEFELPPGVGPAGHVYRGRAGARAAIRRWIGDLDSYESHIDSYLQAGDDRIVVLARDGGFDRETRDRVDRTLGVIVSFRAGRATRVEFHASWAEALEAAGLDPSEAEAVAEAKAEAESERGAGVDPPTGGHDGPDLWP
jgi:ketosteroid isomerase-like protein